MKFKFVGHFRYSEERSNRDCWLRDGVLALGDAQLIVFSGSVLDEDQGSCADWDQGETRTWGSISESVALGDGTWRLTSKCTQNDQVDP